MRTEFWHPTRRANPSFIGPNQPLPTRPQRRQTTQPRTPPDRPDQTSHAPTDFDYIERRVREKKAAAKQPAALKRYLARNLYRLLEHPPATA
jgi:hypothetical protein